MQSVAISGDGAFVAVSNYVVSFDYADCIIYTNREIAIFGKYLMATTAANFSRQPLSRHMKVM